MIHGRIEMFFRMEETETGLPVNENDEEYIMVYEFA